VTLQHTTTHCNSVRMRTIWNKDEGLMVGIGVYLFPAIFRLLGDLCCGSKVRKKVLNLLLCLKKCVRVYEQECTNKSDSESEKQSEIEREREAERERERERNSERERERLCVLVCVRERERETVRLCVRLHVRTFARVRVLDHVYISLCVCVWRGVYAYMHIYL